MAGNHCRTDLLRIIVNGILDNGIEVTDDSSQLVKTLHHCQMLRDNAREGCGACAKEIGVIRASLRKKR